MDKHHVSFIPPGFSLARLASAGSDGSSIHPVPVPSAGLCRETDARHGAQNIRVTHAELKQSRIFLFLTLFNLKF
jgi:hypothetical protein